MRTVSLIKVDIFFLVKHKSSSRIYFMCMFLLVVVLSGYFISNVWDKWKTSPLIVTMGAHGTSVKDIPFPGPYDLLCSCLFLIS